MEDTPEAEIHYVSHRYERSQREDGRRCHKWFLVDHLGCEHLAVVGIETDTMDGHYTYQALEPFASRMPLNCGNQAGVVKYLRELLAGQGGGDDMDDYPTYSGGASSAATGGPGSGRRKAFTSSLCSSRAAILNAAGASPVNFHMSAGSGRGKKKGNTHQTALAYTTGPGGKQKAVGIVQQNQIKKARKYQEDIRAEHERLVNGHLMRLRRAAAAELQADNAAKQITMSWLQGSLMDEELEALDHWRVLLTNVLDLQDQHMQQEAAAGDGGSSQQQQQPPRRHKGISAAAPAAGAGAGHVPDSLVKTLPWLQEPDSRQHHVRVMLECLRELAATEIPARVLLQHKLVALVQRCRCEQRHEAVRSLAGMILTRCKWQLAGHMQVLREPVYMEDHVGVLEEEVSAGLVPLPVLPKYKQALLNTQLPTLPGPGSRHAYTPAHSSHLAQQQYHHHMQHTASSTSQLYDAGAAAAAGFQGAMFAAEGAAAGSEAAAAAVYGGFYTPTPSLLGMQLAASPLSGTAAAAQAAVGSGHQHMMLYGPGNIPGQVTQFLQGQQVLGPDAAAAAAAGVNAATPQGWQGVVGGVAAVPVDSSGAGYGALGAAAGEGAAGAGVILGEQQAAAMAVQPQQQ